MRKGIIRRSENKKCSRPNKVALIKLDRVYLIAVPFKNFVIIWRFPGSENTKDVLEPTMPQLKLISPDVICKIKKHDAVWHTVNKKFSFAERLFWKLNPFLKSGLQREWGGPGDCAFFEKMRKTLKCGANFLKFVEFRCCKFYNSRTVFHVATESLSRLLPFWASETVHTHQTKQIGMGV